MSVPFSRWMTSKPQQKLTVARRCGASVYHEDSISAVDQLLAVAVATLLMWSEMFLKYCALMRNCQQNFAC